MIDTTRMTFGEIIERLIDTKLRQQQALQEGKPLICGKLRGEIVQLTTALDRHSHKKTR